jgi:uncharacterized protein YndB with AHSA1/START domain
MHQRTVVFTHVYDSPRGVLFDLWTCPDLFVLWWGPKDFSNATCELDMRRGIWHAAVRSPKGVVFPLKGAYREVIQPERIVVACDLGEHLAGWPGPLQQDCGAAPDRPATELTITVTFEEQGGKTKLIVCNEFPSGVEHETYVAMGMQTWWNESLGRLAGAAADKLSSNRKSFLIQQTLCADRKFAFTSGEEEPRERFLGLATDTYDFLILMGADSSLPFDPHPWPEGYTVQTVWGKRSRRSLVPDRPPACGPNLHGIEVSRGLLDRWKSWNREYYEVRARNPRLELRDMMQNMSESHDAMSFPDEFMELRIRNWIDAGDCTTPPPFDDRRGVATPEFFNRLCELRKLCREWPF